MKTIEQDAQELLMLADGKPNEIEAIKKLTTKEYYGLMEYVLKKKAKKGG